MKPLKFILNQAKIMLKLKVNHTKANPSKANQVQRKVTNQSKMQVKPARKAKVQKSRKYRRKKATLRTSPSKIEAV